jgi:DNA-binding XRE family transcriptional regulator
LRELEKIPIQRYQGFDPTEAGNHGLMCEMSVAELRERIELNKAKLAQEVEFKRDTNLAKKEREAKNLIEDSTKIEQARIKRKQEADDKRN